MNEDQLAQHPSTKQLRQVLTELSMVSQVKGAPYDTSGGGSGPHDKSGARPPGEIDWKGDREPSYRQKSHLHFLRRHEGIRKGLAKLSDERAEQLLADLLVDARIALSSWRRTPSTPGVDPEKGTRSWKIRIAKDPRPSREVAGQYGCSHISVLRYRAQYEGVDE